MTYHYVISAAGVRFRSSEPFKIENFCAQIPKAEVLIDGVYYPVVDLTTTADSSFSIVLPDKEPSTFLSSIEHVPVEAPPGTEQPHPDWSHIATNDGEVGQFGKLVGYRLDGSNGFPTDDDGKPFTEKKFKERVVWYNKSKASNKHYISIYGNRGIPLGPWQVTKNYRDANPGTPLAFVTANGTIVTNPETL